CIMKLGSEVQCEEKGCKNKFIKTGKKQMFCLSCAKERRYRQKHKWQKENCKPEVLGNKIQCNYKKCDREFIVRSPNHQFCKKHAYKKQREQCRVWLENHKEEIRKKKQVLYKKNVKKVLAKQAEWRKNNKNVDRMRKASWRKNNSEQIHEYSCRMISRHNSLKNRFKKLKKR